MHNCIQTITLATCMSCTQYTPLRGAVTQLAAKNSLTCLHDSALTDLTFPRDG